MARLIDEDALEKEGWSPCRTFQKDKDTMVYETKKLSDLPIIEERKTGRWSIKEGELAFWDVCSECKKMVMHKAPFYNYCPHCGADMRGEEE